MKMNSFQEIHKAQRTPCYSESMQNMTHEHEGCKNHNAKE